MPHLSRDPIKQLQPFTVWLPACIVTDGNAISRWLRIGPGGAMEAIIHYQGRSKFEATARGHRVVCDQPVENGGADQGMTPPEFLLVSLGTCAGYYAAQYSKARKLSTGQLTVRVSAKKATQPAPCVVHDRSGRTRSGNEASGWLGARGQGLPDSQHAEPSAGHRPASPDCRDRLHMIVAVDMPAGIAER